MIPILTDGARLAAWGIGLLLVWVATQRLSNMAHVAMSARGWAPKPRLVYRPVGSGGDLRSSLTALAAGLTALFGYTTPLMGHVARWSTVMAPPAQYLAAVNFFVVVEVFVLGRIAPNPRYKMQWAGCWYIASLLIMGVAGVNGAG